MSNIKFVMLSVFFVCAMSLMAQNNGDEEVRNLYKENYELNKALKDRDKEIEDLKKKLDKVEADRSRADSLLKVEKATGKSKELKSKMQELEQENKRLKSRLDSCASSVERAINNQLEVSQKQVSGLLLQHEQDSMEIVSLKEDLFELSEFRKMWLTQLAESAKEKWLDKPYSQIDAQELETALKTYEEYSSVDNRIADVRDSLKTLLADVRIYTQGNRVIREKYNKDEIEKIAADVRKLHDKVTDPVRKEELSLLCWQLDYYGITVKVFQDLMRAVDNECNNWNTHDAAWNFVKKVLDKLEKEDEYITVIRKIPWLSDQYDRYYKILEENCLGTNSVQKMIMELHP